MAGEHILFVDDEPSIRKLVSSFLQRRGYEVSTANDGVEGLNAVQQQAPDLVITDVNMPNMDGLEFTRQLRNYHATSTIPIIMLSAQKETEDILAGYDEGADEYIPKPVEMAVLAAKVMTILRRLAGAPKPDATSIATQQQRQQEQLRIQIDTSKRARQVEEITGTDFFRDLQVRARTLRGANASGN